MDKRKRKLTDEQVKEIIESRKNSRKKLREIASEYNVSISLISRICNGKRRII
jgi:transcriptional regulator with XRE-family HTH domain